MRGHWVTSGLRKLNKHYQSSGNMAEKTWDGSKDLSPADCIVAPSYVLMRNGQMINAIPYASLAFTPSPMPGIDMCKIDCTVEPYIPKIADKYFSWNEETQGAQKEVTWFAGENCKVYFREKLSMIIEENPLFNTIPEGTDFSSLSLPLIVPEYDVYVLRRSESGGVDTKELFTQLGGGKCKYNFKTYSNKEMDEYRSLVGSFGNENIDLYYNTETLPENLNNIENRYDGTWNNVFITGAIGRSPSSEGSWSGRQTITGINSGCVSRYWNSKLPGCAHGDGSVYGTTYFNRLANIGSEYAFAMMYILKRLRKEERTITG
jgi:hypothetical protein